MSESDERPQISLTCRANEETSVRVFIDEPLVLSVVIVNDSAVAADSQNAPLSDQIRVLESRLREGSVKEDEFRRAVGDIEKNMLKVKIYRFGGPEGWPLFIKFQALSGNDWRDIDWPLKLSVFYPPSQVVDLDATTTCYAEYGLDPEDPRRPIGEFQVKAIAVLAEDLIVESEVVNLNLLKERMPKPESDKEESLLKRSKYAYRRGLQKEAEKYAKAVLKINPSSIPALQLLGNIEEDTQNVAAALSLYEKAYEEFKKQYPDRREPPELIVEKINRLRARREE